MDTNNERSAIGVDSVTNLMQSLYQRAEAALGQRVNQSPAQFAALSPAQAQRTLHDLQVHQIELEMQNEELRRKQVELDESLARYVNFYDLAPVGYCSVTEKGLIKESNLTTSTLLNVPRSQLLKQPITRFIFNDDQDIYYQLRRKLRDIDKPLSCELRLLKRDGAPFWAQLEVAKVQEGVGDSEMRLVIKDITERKRAELQHQQDHEILHAILETTQDGYLQLAPDGKIIDVNQQYALMSGYTREELLGMTVLDLITAENKEQSAARFKLIMEQGHHEFESVHQRKDGTLWNVELSANYGGAARGQLVGFLRDITERKQREQVLRDSQRRLVQAQAIAKVGNWSYEVADRAIEWSDELWHIYGRTPHSVELTYESVVSWIREDFRDYHNDCMRRMLELGPGETVKDFVYCLVRPDGEQSWVEVFMEVEFGTQGKPLRFLGVVKDITEQRAVELELRRAANVFSHATEGIMITDPDGTIIEVNAAFARITGYSRAEALRQNPRILQSGRQNKEFYLAMWRDLLAAGHWSGEIWNKRKTGEIYPEFLNIAAVKDAKANTLQYVAIFSDISDRKHSEELVQQLAYYDPLTGLANRLLLSDRATQAMLASKRTGHHGALLLLDLDNFKSLNDNYGHGAGDLLLMEVALRLKSCVREVDAVARFGGDEFVVLLIDLAQDEVTAKEQAVVLAEKIRGLLAAPYVLTLAADADRDQQVIEHHCTASLGVALFLGMAVSEEESLKRADIAMYQAKNSGRNTVCFFDTLMQVESTSHVIFENDIRKAVLDKQFRVYYQAQVARNSEVTGVEALLRWQHPARGWVSPAEFIPMAEKTGLILPLGLWVLETACTQLARWAKQAATANLTMAVNVTARQFQQGDFVKQLIAVLERTGANPRQLKLELTESVLITDVESVIVKMNLLNAKGISFSLDDFGTGYSSLSYLKRLPLSQLKIAQNFVRDILIDPNDMGIARMVIALADSMGLTTIAEGVETEAQRDFLAMLGCTRYQGFLFCSPMPIGEFEAFIKGT